MPTKLPFLECAVPDTALRCPLLTSHLEQAFKPLNLLSYFSNGIITMPSIWSFQKTQWTPLLHVASQHFCSEPQPTLCKLFEKFCPLTILRWFGQFDPKPQASRSYVATMIGLGRTWNQVQVREIQEDCGASGRITCGNYWKGPPSSFGWSGLRWELNWELQEGSCLNISHSPGQSFRNCQEWIQWRHKLQNRTSLMPELPSESPGICATGPFLAQALYIRFVCTR
jgi:hypothetical protein